MKKIGIVVMAMMIMAVGSVMAIPSGFHLDNDIIVTGDYEWTGGSWQITNPGTASFNMNIDSNTATVASFTETASFGTPWHLDYVSSASVNAPVSFHNVLNAVTVNPPDTTPGTDWTKVHYVQVSGSEFSQTALTVNGYGNIAIDSKVDMDSFGGQNVALNIN